ncbi:MAG: hypothetical protein AAGH60_04350 [Pseudomonadota bacterium]
MGINFISFTEACRAAAITGLMLLAACGHVDFENAPEGEFDGTLFVMWVGEGGSSGDGAFVFVPNPRDPLIFRRSVDGTVREIRPQLMYTDGGSIPKLGQVFEGLSPWGYAPAYMVHDWLFAANQCLTDGLANEEEMKIEGMSFQESADIIAEAIKTLIETNQVSRNDVAPQVISSAVAGPIARRAWEREGACRNPRVSEEDELAARSGIPGARVSLRGAVRRMDNGDVVPIRPAQIVSVVSF